MPFDCGGEDPDLDHVNRGYLFLGAAGPVARVSSGAAWWCWALWMGLRVSHHRDATPGLLVPSVSPVARPSEPYMLEGYRFESVRRFCVWVVWLNKRSSSPAFNLSTRALKHVAIRSCESKKPSSRHLTWKKQSQNKGINTTIVFLGRHNIYAVLQVAYCCKRGFQQVYCQIRNKSPQTSANDQLSYKIQLSACRMLRKCGGLSLIIRLLLAV